MSRRPDHLGKRKEFSEKLKQEIRKRENYQCEKCGESAIQVDHIKPAALGGRSTYDNAQLLCDSCHDVKSAIDRANALKADKMGGRVGQYSRRQKAKANGTYKPIPSPGFSKTLRKKINGKVEKVS